MHPSVKLFLHKQLLISYTVAQSFVFFEHDDVLYYLQLDYPVSDFGSLSFGYFVQISPLKKYLKGKFIFCAVLPSRQLHVQFVMVSLLLPLNIFHTLF